MQSIDPNVNLTDEEKAVLRDVLSKAQQIVNEEQENINELKDNLENIEDIMLTIDEIREKPNCCSLCAEYFSGFSLLFSPFKQCGNCKKRICKNCISFYSDATPTCIYCDLRHKLNCLDGSWFYQSPERLKTKVSDESYESITVKTPLVTFSSVSETESPEPIEFTKNDVLDTIIEKSEYVENASRGDLIELTPATSIELGDINQPYLEVVKAEIFKVTNETGDAGITTEFDKHTYDNIKHPINSEKDASTIEHQTGAEHETFEKTFLIQKEEDIIKDPETEIINKSEKAAPLQLDIRADIHCLSSREAIRKSIEGQKDINIIEGYMEDSCKLSQESIDIQPLPTVKSNIEEVIEEHAMKYKIGLEFKRAIHEEPILATEVKPITHEEVVNKLPETLQTAKLDEKLTKKIISESITTTSSNIPETTLKKTLLDDQSFATSSLHGSINIEPFDNLVIVTINVIEAMNLIPLSSSENISSYVTCQVRSDNKVIFKGQTLTIEDSSSPVWNETFEFTCQSVDLNRLIIILLVKKPQEKEPDRANQSYKDSQKLTYGSIMIGNITDSTIEETNIWVELNKNKANNITDWVEFKIPLRNKVPLEALFQMSMDFLSELTGDISTSAEKEISVSLSDRTTNLVEIPTKHFCQGGISGILNMFLKYVDANSLLTVKVLTAEGLNIAIKVRKPTKMIAICKIITKTPYNKQKVTIISTDVNKPEFNSTSSFNLDQNLLNDTYLIVNMYCIDHMANKIFVGQVFLPIKAVLCEKSLEISEGFTKSYSLSQKIPYTQYGFLGTVGVSLRFDPSDTDSQFGDLEVCIIKGTKISLNGKEDPFELMISFALLPILDTASIQRTNMFKYSNDPEWNYTITFSDICIYDLKTSTTIEILIWTRNVEFVGGLRIGPCHRDDVDILWNDSNKIESDLWNEMIRNPKIWASGTIPLRYCMLSQNLYPSLNSNVLNLFNRSMEKGASLCFDIMYLTGEIPLIYVNLHNIKGLLIKYDKIFCKILFYSNGVVERSLTKKLESINDHEWNHEIEINIPGPIETSSIEFRIMSHKTSKEILKNGGLIFGRVVLSGNACENTWTHSCQEELDIFNNIIKSPNDLNSLQLPIHFCYKPPKISSAYKTKKLKSLKIISEEINTEFEIEKLKSSATDLSQIPQATDYGEKILRDETICNEVKEDNIDCSHGSFKTEEIAKDDLLSHTENTQLKQDLMDKYSKDQEIKKDKELKFIPDAPLLSEDRNLIEGKIDILKEIKPVIPEKAIPSDIIEESSKSVVDSETRIKPIDKTISTSKDKVDNDINLIKDLLHEENLKKIGERYKKMIDIPNVESVPTSGISTRHVITRTKTITNDAISVYTNAEINGKVLIRLEYNTYEGLLIITLKKGANFSPHDKKKSKNDIFARINIYPDRSKNAEFRTQTLKNTSDPEWNETFMYSVNESNLQLRKIVFDFYHRALTKKVSLGQIIIPLDECYSQLKANSFVEKWYQLNVKAKLPELSIDQTTTAGSLGFNATVIDNLSLSSSKKKSVSNAILRITQLRASSLSFDQPISKAICKVSFLSDKHQEDKKTTNATPNMLGSFAWNETLEFNINKEKLAECGLVIKICDSKKTSFILSAIKLNNGSKRFSWQVADDQGMKIWDEIISLNNSTKDISAVIWPEI